jgi:hypothetical protein
VRTSSISSLSSISRSEHRPFRARTVSGSSALTTDHELTGFAARLKVRGNLLCAPGITGSVANWVSN